MPVQPRQTVEIPKVSIPTWVFSSPEVDLPREAVILDPEAPGKRHLSLHSYRYWSQRFAAGLQSAGLGHGERVLLLSQNSTGWPILFMGTIMAGGVFSGQSPTMAIDKLVHQASDVDPSFIMASEAGYSSAIEVARRISLSEGRVYLFEDEFLFEGKDPKDVRSPDGRPHWAQLVKDTSVPFDWTKCTSHDQIAAINYTSGSTGDSKGVMISHYNLIANGAQYIHQQSSEPTSPEFQGQKLIKVNWTPIYHIIGVTQYCMIMPKRGVINYIMRKFDLETMLKYIEQFHSNFIFLAPAPLIQMLSHPAARSTDLSRVHTISVGGAPLRESTLQRLRDLMPNKSLRIQEGWGMTEVTGVAISTSPLSPVNVRSQGELMPNTIGKVLTPDGLTELGPNQPGELYIKSPHVAQGYRNLPELTERTFLPDGWLRTGDLAVYDSEGNWMVKDRIQDMISHESGAYALPTDLESKLLGLPGVRDAGIALVEPSTGGKHKVPRAFLVLDREQAPDAAKVGEQFNRAAEPHEQLSGGVYEIDGIPRLPSGKVDRVSLRKRPVS